MMRRHPCSRSSSGFTLIEIIVTLLLIGMTAAVMFPALGNNLVQSPEPVIRLNRQYLLMQEMEKWTGRYRSLIDSGTLNLAAFKLEVENGAGYLDSAGTVYINSFNDGAYVTQGTDKLLKVTLRLGDQRLYAIFSDDAP